MPSRDEDPNNPKRLVAVFVAGTWTASVPLAWVLLQTTVLHHPANHLDHPECVRGFRVLLVTFAVLAGLVGLLVMRWLPGLVQRETDRVYSEFVERTSEGILLVQADTLAIVQANPAVCALLSRTSEELGLRTLPEVLPMSPAAVISLRGLMGRSRVHLGEVPHTVAGRARHLELLASPMSWRGTDVLCVVARDVTARRTEEERTRHMAWHDQLTGLPNRACFQARLATTLAQTRNRGEVLAVAFVDIDQFKAVNDTVGHDAADRLLIDVATRLREAVRAGDVVARQSGDEFLVLLPRLAGREDAGTFAERLLGVFREPFMLEGREFSLTCSVGMAVFPDDGDDASDLVKHADVAMFQAKEAGRDGWQLYDATLRARSAQLVETRTALTHALERDELILHYQPQVSFHTGEIIGVEALIRWNRDGRMVPPMEFIPIAEQTGLIAPIGVWVIDEACRQAAQWQAEGLPPVRMAVNLSARQFFNGGVVDAVDAALARHGLDPRWLEVEITESLAMKNAEVARRVLEQLRERGVSVALDDFGTGYSSLAYLRQFPIDRLKLDRAFLAGAATDPEQRALVGAIITLAHAIRMEVVAEGLETADQLGVLLSQGCDIGQGFGLSRPLDAQQVGHLLADNAHLLNRLRVARVA
jgi:diguanylate cyclase (GGDEF)-like protein/PAS domain S-box-containing protein